MRSRAAAAVVVVAVESNRQSAYHAKCVCHVCMNRDIWL